MPWCLGGGVGAEQHRQKGAVSLPPSSVLTCTRPMSSLLVQATHCKIGQRRHTTAGMDSPHQPGVQQENQPGMNRQPDMNQQPGGEQKQPGLNLQPGAHEEQSGVNRHPGGVQEQPALPPQHGVTVRILPYSSSDERLRQLAALPPAQGSAYLRALLRLALQHM